MYSCESTRAPGTDAEVHTSAYVSIRQHTSAYVCWSWRSTFVCGGSKGILVYIYIYTSI